LHHILPAGICYHVDVAELSCRTTDLRHTWERWEITLHLVSQGWSSVSCLISAKTDMMPSKSVSAWKTQVTEKPRIIVVW